MDSTTFHADQPPATPAPEWCEPELSGAARTALSCRSLRCTKQRLDVFEALAATKSHPTAEQLHRMVSDRSPGISLATVYNTLEALSDARLCRKIPTCNGNRYDADLSEHVHVVMPDGRLMDVPADLGAELLKLLPEDLRQRLGEALGVAIDHVAVQLHAGETGRIGA